MGFSWNGGGGGKVLGPSFLPDKKKFQPSAFASQNAEWESVTGDIKLPERMSFNNTSAYQAKKVDGPLQEYDAIRTRIQRQHGAQEQQTQDALARRFAAMNGLRSGAYIKATQNARDSSAAQQEQAMQNVDFQEAQQRRQLQQIEDQKGYESGEAFKNRDLQIQNMRFQQEVAQFDAASKLRSIDAAYNAQKLAAIESQFNKEMAMYQAENSGGLFGAGGFLGLGI